ncbi:MAG: Nucleoside-triphosphatase rdgB [Firmicutes bacterium]|nr:Nucleoside-triphosphatase rdgB [Bacillota bacterium]
MKPIVIASTNKGKISEIRAAFQGLPLEIHSLAEFGGIPEVEETGKTFAENAVLKATYYARHTGMACLADDSGLEVDALGGAPGVYSARFAGDTATDEDNNRKLLAALQEVPREQRSARFRCVLAFLDVDGTILTADGTCEGRILEEPRGTGGFGYDPLFCIPKLGATLSEISLAEKNAVSHRGQALKIMTEKLAKQFAQEKEQ